MVKNCDILSIKLDKMLWYAYMSEQKSVETSAEAQVQFKKVFCYICHLPLNFKTKKEVDYDRRKAENEVWCRHCERWVKFSLK